VCSLERPAEAGDLSDAERAALKFADLFATNHLAIDDAAYDDLREHFTEDQLVALGLHCALCVGLGRLAATWHVVDDVPEEFRGESDATCTVEREFRCRLGLDAIHPLAGTNGVDLLNCQLNRQAISPASF
jgi:hypothetical protein